MQTLKEITVTADRPIQPNETAVENMSRVVCSLLMRSLQDKVRSPDFWKISIRINFDDLSEDGKVLLGVLVVNREFPTDDFVGWPKEKRQSYMLEFVAETLFEVFIQRGLESSLIEEAVRFVTEQEFQNMFKSKKRFKSPSGDQVAHIECEQEIDEARIYVVFENGMQDRVHVATTVPEEFIFQAFFGRVEWDDSQQPVLHRVDGTSIPIRSARRMG